MRNFVGFVPLSKIQQRKVNELQVTENYIERINMENITIGSHRVKLNLKVTWTLMYF